MKLRIGIVLAFVAIAVAGCGGAPKSSVDPETNLVIPGDVQNGGRVVYVLNDVSCDMNTPADRANRERALMVGATGAAMDDGTLEVGVVRAVASQNLEWQPAAFADMSHAANTARFRVQAALANRDKVVKRFRGYVNRSAGNVNGCASDLVAALSAVATNQEEIGATGKRTDLIYVTNGLIVDRRTHIILTKDSLGTEKQVRKTLAKMRQDYPLPDLKGIHIWLVGVGWSPGIKNDLTGARVRELWTTYLAKTGATVQIFQNSTALPSVLTSLPG